MGDIIGNIIVFLVGKLFKNSSQHLDKEDIKIFVI